MIPKLFYPFFWLLVVLFRGIEISSAWVAETLTEGYEWIEDNLP